MKLSLFQWEVAYVKWHIYSLYCGILWNPLEHYAWVDVYIEIMKFSLKMYEWIRFILTSPNPILSGLYRLQLCICIYVYRWISIKLETISKKCIKKDSPDSVHRCWLLQRLRGVLPSVAYSETEIRHVQFSGASCLALI